MKKFLILGLLPALLFAQEKTETKRELGHYDTNKFSQLYDLLATPNMFRTASGAPGPAYYQQQADYKIYRFENYCLYLSSVSCLQLCSRTVNRLALIGGQPDVKTLFYQR